MSYEPCSCPRHREERGEPVDEYDSLAWKDKAEHLAARLAAAEAERDAKHERILEISRLSLGFEGRLAAVRALCDEEAVWNSPPHATNSEVRWFANDIRAVIDQEDDRG